MDEPDNHEVNTVLQRYESQLVPRKGWKLPGGRRRTSESAAAAIRFEGSVPSSDDAEQAALRELQAGNADYIADAGYIAHLHKAVHDRDQALELNMEALVKMDREAQMWKRGTVALRERLATAEAAVRRECQARDKAERQRGVAYGVVGVVAFFVMTAAFGLLWARFHG